LKTQQTGCFFKMVKKRLSCSSPQFTVENNSAVENYLKIFNKISYFYIVKGKLLKANTNLNHQKSSCREAQYEASFKETQNF
jgi:hypothetical protein